jgi:hypothetical protein
VHGVHGVVPYMGLRLRRLNETSARVMSFFPVYSNIEQFLREPHGPHGLHGPHVSGSRATAESYRNSRVGRTVQYLIRYRVCVIGGLRIVRGLLWVAGRDESRARLCHGVGARIGLL